MNPFKSSGGSTYCCTTNERRPAATAGGQGVPESGAAGCVMGMIQQIINDAKAMEAEAVHDEEDAQAGICNKHLYLII